MQDDIRWVQRLQNLTKAFLFLKNAYQYELIDDGDLWMDMLEKRNLMAHSYDEERALTALGLIRNQYAPQFVRLVDVLVKKRADRG